VVLLNKRRLKLRRVVGATPIPSVTAVELLHCGDQQKNFKQSQVTQAYALLVNRSLRFLTDPSYCQLNHWIRQICWRGQLHINQRSIKENKPLAARGQSPRLAVHLSLNCLGSISLAIPQFETAAKSSPSIRRRRTGGCCFCLPPLLLASSLHKDDAISYVLAA